MAGLVTLPAGAAFIPALADRLLQASLDDGALILVPSVRLATALKSALGRIEQRTFRLPTIKTLEMLTGIVQDDQDRVVRALVVARALREGQWVPDVASLQVAETFVAFCDQLSDYAIDFPNDEQELAAQLEQAYQLTQDNGYLRLEARLALNLWRALVNWPNRCHQREIALADLARYADNSLIWVDDLNPQPQALRLFNHWPEGQKIRYRPEAILSHASLSEPRQLWLHLAWSPTLQDATFVERRDRLRAQFTHSPLRECVRYQACGNQVLMAESIVATVLSWLHEGITDIALIAQNRSCARQVRALLEYYQVLVEDESGWILATSRAATVVDDWFNVVIKANKVNLLAFLNSDELNWASAPGKATQLADLMAQPAGNALTTLVNTYRERPEMFELYEHLRSIAQALSAFPEPGQRRSLTDWCTAVDHMLTTFALDRCWRSDAAGAKLLQLIAQLRIPEEPLALSLTFAEFRHWWNRRLEETTFADTSIKSSVCFTHLAAAIYRPWQAIAVIGSDEQHLNASRSPGFFGAAVESLFNLPSHIDRWYGFFEQLAQLICSAQRTVFFWCADEEGEAVPITRPLALLESLHEKSGFGALSDSAQALLYPMAGADTRMPGDPLYLADATLPNTLSASAWQTLVDCPYQYAMRHVWRLVPQVYDEAFSKKEYGQYVHEILHRFHRAYPGPITDQDQALTTLSALSQTVFFANDPENFYAHIWYKRWQSRMPLYLTWWRGQSDQGWRVVAMEEQLTREISLASEQRLLLVGRIDRQDQRQTEQGVASLNIDYKTTTVTAVKRMAADSEYVQLAFYRLLSDDDANTSLVALDDDGKVASAESDVFANELARITDVFNRLHQAHALPAHGRADVCRYCDYPGLCRQSRAGM